MNFNSKFIKLIRTLFTNQEAHITAAGKISAPFRVERGVRQGDPLSPLLYILAFDPLLQKLNRELTGIQLENIAFKASAYADDLTLGIGSRTDWDIIKRNFALYEGASNAKINQNKSKLIPLTNAARSLELVGGENLKTISEQETITILGYEVHPNGLPKKDLWSSTINKLKSSFEKLASRNLSFKGKILLANSLILIYSIPTSSKQKAHCRNQ